MTSTNTNMVPPATTTNVEGYWIFIPYRPACPCCGRPYGALPSYPAPYYPWTQPVWCGTIPDTTGTITATSQSPVDMSSTTGYDPNATPTT